MNPLLTPGRVWDYKNAAYIIDEVQEDHLIQDPLGDWVPTVKYHNPGVPGKFFYRAFTEFLHKFRPRP